MLEWNKSDFFKYFATLFSEPIALGTDGITENSFFLELRNLKLAFKISL